MHVLHHSRIIYLIFFLILSLFSVPFVVKIFFSSKFIFCHCDLLVTMSPLLFLVCVRVTVLLHIFMLFQSECMSCAFLLSFVSALCFPSRAHCPRPPPSSFYHCYRVILKSLIIFPSPSPIFNGPQISFLKASIVFDSSSPVFHGSFLIIHILNILM